jgi:hypothetical protein
MLELCRRVLTVLLAMALLGSCESPAADSPTADAKETSYAERDEALSKVRHEYMLRAMRKYAVVLDGKPQKVATFRSDASLRWSNPIGDVDDGLLAVYSTSPTERPAMIASLCLHGPAMNGAETHEFADIHPGPVELVRGSKSVWLPATRYSKFERLPDAPAPSKTAALRMAQIKQMAARFEFVDLFRETDSAAKPHVLRMMPRPTYRYGDAESEIIDAAIFTFVVATDPEACLLIEIHRKDQELFWEYLVIPMTTYALEAKLDGKVVWTKPEAVDFSNSSAPHYIAPYERDPGELPFGEIVSRKPASN